MYVSPRETVLLLYTPRPLQKVLTIAKWIVLPAVGQLARTLSRSSYYIILYTLYSMYILLNILCNFRPN